MSACMCCFPAPSQCCCPARTHRAGQAGRDAWSLLKHTPPSLTTRAMRYKGHEVEGMVRGCARGTASQAAGTAPGQQRVSVENTNKRSRTPMQGKSLDPPHGYRSTSRKYWPSGQSTRQSDRFWSCAWSNLRTLFSRGGVPCGRARIMRSPTSFTCSISACSSSCLWIASSSLIISSVRFAAVSWLVICLHAGSVFLIWVCDNTATASRPAWPGRQHRHAWCLFLTYAAHRAGRQSVLLGAQPVTALEQQRCRARALSGDAQALHAQAKGLHTAVKRLRLFVGRVHGSSLPPTASSCCPGGSPLAGPSRWPHGPCSTATKKQDKQCQL